MPALVARPAMGATAAAEASSTSTSSSSDANPLPLQLLVRGLDGAKTYCVQLPQHASVADLQRAVHTRSGVPADAQVLTHAGRLLSPARAGLGMLQQQQRGDDCPAASAADAANADNHPLLASLFPHAHVPRDACVHLSLRLLGGKGGFGAQLRAAGRAAKTDNFDACRDLSGRRVRHADAEAKLRQWEAEAPERELERAAQRHLAEMARKQRREAREVEFDGKAAREEQERAAERAREGARGAVAEALARTAKKNKEDGRAPACRQEEEDEEEKDGASSGGGGTTTTAAAEVGPSGSGSEEPAAAAARGKKRAAADEEAPKKQQQKQQPSSPKRAKPAAAPAAPRPRGMLALVEGSDSGSDSGSD